MRCFLTLCTMAIPFLRRSTSAAADAVFPDVTHHAIPFLRRSTSAAADAVERASFPPAPPVVRSPPARMRKPSSPFRPRGVRAAAFFAHRPCRRAQIAHKRQNRVRKMQRSAQS